ncbi:MAG: LPXTG cell wall anchor domain-containing protein [Clostridiales bacterium]|nr:LPXTG cell wall anchor domain-containing protein [Clostridiales bacterium]
MRTQFRKLTRCGLALAAALMLMLGVALPAYAASGASLDLSKTGSVTLTLADSGGDPVSGGEISLYQVATLGFNKKGDMAYTLTEQFQDCTLELDVTDTALAGELAQFAAENGVSGTAAAVGEDGTVTFSQLTLGLYLLVQTTASDNYETITPFVVTVPIDSDGEWVYDVDASPKVGTVATPEPDEPEEPEKPEEPEPESPEEPDTPIETEETDSPTETTKTVTKTTTTTTTTTTATSDTLPQTGQLNWPVPLLAGSGVLLFALGWILKNKGKENRP